VCDYGREREVASGAELEIVLAERTANGMNCWWVSFDAMYPCVAILANGNLACVHYHPEDQHPGFQAQGPPIGLNANDQTMFSIDGPNEQIWMPNSSVIDFLTAIRVVRDFLRDQKMSPAVPWLELCQ
jgi:hypothetical protein